MAIREDLVNDKKVICILIKKDDFGKFFRQTVDFIFIDVCEVNPGVSAIGRKFLKENEWYFSMHFPGNPVMPGVFQMEAMMQTAGLIINCMDGKENLALMMSECKNIRIIKSVRPGDEIQVNVKMNSYRRGLAWFEGCVSVDNETSAKMEFSLVAPDEILTLKGTK